MKALELVRKLKQSFSTRIIARPYDSAELIACFEASNRTIDLVLAEADRLIQAQGEVEDRWIPVSERLPELNKDVLWLNKYGDMAVSCLEKGWTNLLRVQWGEAGMLELEYLTHWQPLPTPPRTKDKKEGE